MMLDTFFIAVEAFDIITLQLPVVGIESRMGIKAIGSSGKALGIWNQNINTPPRDGNVYGFTSISNIAVSIASWSADRGLVKQLEQLAVPSTLNRIIWEDAIAIRMKWNLREKCLVLWVSLWDVAVECCHCS
jgi:hypothetical protein